MNENNLPYLMYVVGVCLPPCLLALRGAALALVPGCPALASPLHHHHHRPNPSFPEFLEQIKPEIGDIIVDLVVPSRDISPVRYLDC